MVSKAEVERSISTTANLFGRVAVCMVFVPVMDVGEMRVRMCQRLVNVRMRVRLARVDARRVLVLVMFVVNVAVCVFQSLVQMFMFVLFGEMQPDTKTHQHARRDQQRPDRFM